MSSAGAEREPRPDAREAARAGNIPRAGWAPEKRAAPLVLTAMALAAVAAAVTGLRGGAKNDHRSGYGAPGPPGFGAVWDPGAWPRTEVADCPAEAYYATCGEARRGAPCACDARACGATQTYAPNESSAAACWAPAPAACQGWRGAAWSGASAPRPRRGRDGLPARRGIPRRYPLDARRGVT